eukprot:scaffold2575_cov101-Cylindrotheca_fusiformis.AAC.4
MDSTAIIQHIPESTAPIATGFMAFGATLCMSTMAQKIVGISTANKFAASVCGVATVCLASMASQRAAVYTYNWRHDKRSTKEFLLDTNLRKQLFSLSPPRSSNEYLQITNNLKIPYHDLRVCGVGLAAFMLLGGRFWAIAPSSFTGVGSFGRWSIPCGESYASTQQRVMIEQMGKRWGCHTCGSRMLKPVDGHKFVGDHMPPKSVAAHMNNRWIRKIGLLPKVDYRFYPQCANCSGKQASILGKTSNDIANKWFVPSSVKAAMLKHAGGGNAAHFHGLRVRANHLAGGVLAGVTVVNAKKSDISKGNKKRFKSFFQ